MLGGSAAAAALRPLVAYADDVDDDYASKYNEDGVLIGLDKLKAEVEYQSVALDSASSFKLPKAWKVRSACASARRRSPCKTVAAGPLTLRSRAENLVLSVRVGNGAQDAQP